VEGGVVKHIVSLSGGVASAVAADRVINRHGDAVLWFADTNWEDEDLYRFLNDLEQRWGVEILRWTNDGDNPMDVGKRKHIIPNQKIAPCSFELKIKQFKKYIKTVDKPVTVHLGIDWSEQHRTAAPKRNYEAIEGVTVDFPLLWKPYNYDNFATVKSWGIKIPRL
jgi:3'-phosphoadenosine 5'-phosphosulfate sulfotransferase (PAPS reductase)/FAD synthetase